MARTIGAKGISEKTVDIVRSLFVEGHSCTEISRRTYIPVDRVRYIANFRISDEDRTNHKKNKKQYPFEYKTKTKHDRNAQIARMREDGYTMEEIGTAVGCSRQRVKQIIDYFDLNNPSVIEIRANKLYDFIVHYKAENDGESPPVREMLVYSVRSGNRLRGLLDLLQEQGRIMVEHIQGKKPIIRIIGAEWIPPKEVNGNG